MCKYVVCGRFWGKEGDLFKIEDFANRSLRMGAEQVFIAINEDADKSGALSADWPNNVSVFGVKPWGRFTLSLNALLSETRHYLSEGYKILFSSTEISLSQEMISVLLQNLTSDTLVVGASLEGHSFQVGYKGNVDGRGIPWNTLSIWNPDLLWPIGFVNIGEGIVEDKLTSGVEEYCTMATAQFVYGVPNARVKLLNLPEIKWETDFSDDPERQAKHKRKMQSKIDRPSKQLAVLGLPKVVAEHISIN